MGDACSTRPGQQGAACSFASSTRLESAATSPSQGAARSEASLRFEALWFPVTICWSNAENGA